MNKVQIVSRWNSDTVLFECDAREGLESGLQMRHALENARTARTDLSCADLRGADLRGADLSDADLRVADLSGADLRVADLSGADLSDAEPASPEQSIENLDKVRAIILDNKERLDMGIWHIDDGWRERTCAEETLCETTHCLAGWLQVCNTDPKVREMEPQLAGIVSAPIASKMFFRGAEEVFSWLDERKYVGELAERAARDAERAAKKAAQGTVLSICCSSGGNAGGSMQRKKNCTTAASTAHPPMFGQRESCA